QQGVMIGRPRLGRQPEPGADEFVVHRCRFWSPRVGAIPAPPAWSGQEELLSDFAIPGSDGCGPWGRHGPPLHALFLITLVIPCQNGARKATKYRQDLPTCGGGRRTGGTEGWKLVVRSTGGIRTVGVEPTRSSLERLADCRVSYVLKS